MTPTNVPEPILLTVTAHSQCPDENDLAAFAKGQASAAIEIHLDGCESCRRAVAAAAAEHTLPGMPSSAELTPGMRVGRYEIERELGRGGMGVVYMARDLTLDRHVALKLLHARRDQAAQARLLREAQVMAKLAHQNVVPVFELGDWRDEVYLVMELVSGVTLEHWLKAGKHSRKEILGAFIQAGRGLAAAHAAGVVHRDFKPANVLYGIDGRVRVTDFGLSRPGGTSTLELPPMASPLITREGTLMGTLVYMSPEQLDGKTATEHSDQFSFCVSLAEALSGQRPFDGQTWSALAVSQANKPVLSLSIPRSIRSVLKKGLNVDPHRRFASMASLLNALEAAQNIGWVAVGATSVAALAVCGFIVAGTPLPHRAYPQNDEAPQAAANDPTRTVLVAARDLPAGTVLTYEMMLKREMPEVFFTASMASGGSAGYLVGNPTRVEIRAGDTLLWSHFERPDGLSKTASGMMSLVGEAYERCKSVLPAGTPSGVIKVAWNVSTSGEPLDVRTLPSPYDSTALPACLIEATAHFRYTPGADSEGTGRMYALTVESIPTPQAAIFEVVAQHKEQLAACVDTFHRTHPERHGEMKLMWRIEPNGAPTDIMVVAPNEEPSLDGPGNLGVCLGEALSTWSFPPGASSTEQIRVPIKY